MPLAAELPPDLAAALAARVERAAAGELARATEELSLRYRSGWQGAPVARSPLDVLAYAAYRLPATYAAAAAAMREVRERRREWQPRTLLDLGAGPGAAAWAAAHVWPSLERIDAVDAVRRMVDLGRELALSARHPALRSMSWQVADLTSAPRLEAHDLVVLSYAAGELAPPALEAVVERAWQATRGVLLAVEPGTLRGYATVLGVRTALLGRAATTLGPCPHDAACPMGGGDWCHFAVRLPRTPMHRAAKGGALGHEDEKFSWAALTREPAAPGDARILRHPQVRGGHVRLELCTRDGLRSVVVSRRDGAAYRRARKASWGETFPADGAAAGERERSGLEAGAPTVDD